MTSVGYGDIPSVTLSQHIVSIVSMCFACVLFGNIIGNLQGYIQNYDASGKFYENEARKLKNHLKRHNLPSMLKNKVVQYIYYLKTLSTNNDPKDLDILESLSPPLREEIFVQTRGYFLAKSAVFRCFTGSFLKNLAYHMKVEAFAPGDKIIKEGEMSNIIYYLCNGKVQIYHEATKTVFKDIKKNKYFGEISFFLDTCRNSSAMSMAFSEFLTLDRKSFFAVLSARPKEMEVTKVIIHHSEKYNDLSLLGIRCYLCRKMGHVAKNCKEFVFVPDKKNVAKKAEAKKYNYSKPVNSFSDLSNYQRNNFFYDYYRNYDVSNTLGKRFNPGKKYQGNSRIISKANMMIGKKFNKRIGKEM